MKTQHNENESDEHYYDEGWIDSVASVATPCIQVMRIADAGRIKTKEDRKNLH